MRLPRRVVPLVLAALLLPLAAGAAPTQGEDAVDAADIAPAGLMVLRGDLHAHTCYSDGQGTPDQAFALVKAAGFYDFFAITDHSEALEFPLCGDEACIEDFDFADPLACWASPLPWATEWEATGAMAQAATDADFVALRGFEWSHPGEGHVNVWGSQAYVNAYATLGPTMAPFYAWLAAPAPAGGADGVASFNHAGREPMMFDGLAHSPLADPHIQAFEVYNRGDTYVDEYLRALDRGWHVGAIGVSDGHTPDKWVRVRGHTVLLAEERTPEGVLAALAARRTVGTDDPFLQVVFEAAGTLMGGTTDAPEVFPARIHARDIAPTGAPDAASHGIARLTVWGSGGRDVASLEAGGAAEVVWEPWLGHADDGRETWFVVQVEDLGGRTGWTAPVWVR